MWRGIERLVATAPLLPFQNVSLRARQLAHSRLQALSNSTPLPYALYVRFAAQVIDAFKFFPTFLLTGYLAYFVTRSAIIHNDKASVTIHSYVGQPYRSAAQLTASRSAK